MTEVIADPHFQRRDSVTRTANLVGFVEREIFGDRISFTINFEKTQNAPNNGLQPTAYRPDYQRSSARHKVFDWGRSCWPGSG